jgi:hypothetical protein
MRGIMDIFGSVLLGFQAEYWQSAARRFDFRGSMRRKLHQWVLIKTTSRVSLTTIPWFGRYLAGQNLFRPRLTIYNDCHRERPAYSEA